MPCPTLGHWCSFQALEIRAHWSGWIDEVMSNRLGHRYAITDYSPACHRMGNVCWFRWGVTSGCSTLPDRR